MGNGESSSSQEFNKFLKGYEGEKMHMDFRFGHVRIYNSKRDINKLIIVGDKTFIGIL